MFKREENFHPMDKRRLIVRATGGSMLVGMVSLLSLGVLSIYLGVKDALLRGVHLGTVGCLLIGGYFSASALRYLLYPQIELTDTELIAQTSEFGRPFFPLARSFQEVRQMLFPRFSKKHVRLDDIETILIGEMRYFNKIAGELKSDMLNETLQFWHSWLISPKLFMPLWPAARYRPLIFVQAKQGGSIVIDTKPFPKAGVRVLTQALKQRGISIMAQPSLGL